MIAAWMLYCALCALGLSLAGVLAERLLAGRGPVRHIWIVTVLLSIAVPAAAFRFSAPVASPAPSTLAVGQSPAADVLDSIEVAPVGDVRHVPAAASRRSWRAVLAQADTPLAILWLTLSSALVAHFLCGMIALTWMRRWWRRDTLQGVDVLVSESTGPALVGALSPAIVVPRWTLDMEASQVGLMLRHEEEHRRARDGQLLTVAHFALIAMPWNVALWWQLMRLRVAVELDCDARVLRDADARSYGDLLLEVARPRRRLMLMGATAFAERASQLERRIRAIGRRREKASRMARLGVACVGVIVVTAAWVAPRPPVPARSAPQPISPAPALPRDDSSAVPAPKPVLVEASSLPVTPIRPLAASEQERMKPPQSTRSGADSVPHQSVAAPVVGNDSTAPANSPALERRVVAGNPVVRLTAQGQALTAQQGDSIFEHLFAGITLTPDQEAMARDLVNQLEIAQTNQMVNMVRALVAVAPLRQAIQAQADSGLEALLTNDADRALLHTRFVPQVPGGRGVGRSSTLVGDTSFVMAGGGGRGARVGGGGGGFVAPTGSGGGGGRGGGRGGAGGVVSPTMSIDAIELALHRFFDGITLTPQQAADARTIIGKMQADMRAVNPLPPSPILARRASNMVAMSPESAVAFASLLTNDADRATLQSHIVVEVRRTLETPPR